MVKVISISLSDADKKLLDDMELSPSGLFKQKMQDVRENSYNFETRIKILEGNILNLQNRIRLMYEYLEKKDLFKDFQQYEESLILNNNVLEKK